MKVTRLPPQFVTISHAENCECSAPDHGNVRRHEIRVLYVVTPTLNSARYATLAEQAASWMVGCEDHEVAGIDWNELDRLA